MNNNPMFYEVFDLDYEVYDQDDLKSYPPFLLDVKDQDRGGTDTTFLGRAIVHPDKCTAILK